MLLNKDKEPAPSESRQKSRRQKHKKRKLTQSESKPHHPWSPASTRLALISRHKTPPQASLQHPKTPETPHPKTPRGPHLRTQKSSQRWGRPQTKQTPQRETLHKYPKTTHSRRKEMVTTSAATKNSGMKGTTRTRTTRKGLKGPYNPLRKNERTQSTSTQQQRN